MGTNEHRVDDLRTAARPDRAREERMRTLGDRRSLVLRALSAAFGLRVLGQALVMRRSLRWLPPMEQWQSGILPYPALLASQLAILGTQIAVIRRVPEFSGGSRLAGPLRWFGRLYAGTMVVRYIVSMARHPERRPFGKTIPIVFHLVLATWVMVLASLLRTGAGAAPGQRRGGSGRGEC